MRIDNSIKGLKNYIFKDKKDVKGFLLKELKKLSAKEIVYLINVIFNEEMNNHLMCQSAWLKGELG